MRFVKTGAIALMVAGAALIGSGAAHAGVLVTLTDGLIACAEQNKIDLGTSGSATPGQATLTVDAVAQLMDAGCLL
ncbi:hypothetical protein D5S18_33560 [Nocardia panacis]|uniref:DUF732 domain-containing protein n=1 Tax=Nocardia panacis TaxID=2340916 RepID=A0A3A4KHC6_9NOCA|nr:hypothetical protein [Nocardia panacis]RJO68345.1 hypothetical protein D5S18_33560 [Nocardia panacis]